MAKNWLLMGGLFGFLYVALGAFGAHALKAMLAAEKMAVLHTANQYLGYHGLALILLGLMGHSFPELKTKAAGLCFLFGILIFSGSLYIYALLDLRIAAMITPIGGSLFLIAWILFITSSFKVSFK